MRSPRLTGCSESGGASVSRSGDSPGAGMGQSVEVTDIGLSAYHWTGVRTEKSDQIGGPTVRSMTRCSLLVGDFDQKFAFVVTRKEPLERIRRVIEPVDDRDLVLDLP